MGWLNFIGWGKQSVQEKAQTIQALERKGFTSGNNKGNFFLEAVFGNKPHTWTYSDYNRVEYAMLYRSRGQGNGTVFSVVSRLASACAEMSNAIEVVDEKGEVIENHPIHNVLRNPNDLTSKGQLIETMVVNLLTVGDTFTYMTNPLFPDNTGLYVIPSESVSIVSSGIIQPIKGYVITGSIMGMKPKLTPANTIFIRNPNTDPDSLFGLSPLAAISKELAIYGIIPSREYKIIEEGGVRAILTPTDFPVDKNAEVLINDLEKIINSKNAKTNLLLQTPLQRIAMGDSMADMSLDKKKESIKIEICNVYGFPKNLLLDNSTFNNMKEGKQLVYTICIPIVTRIFEGLGARLLQSNERFKLNTDKIPELKPDNTDKVAQFSSILTVNELRIMQGYPPLTGEQYDKIAISKKRTTTEEETTI